MTIRYSPAAHEDLRTLRRYLVDEFGAAVADRSVRKIVSDIALLKLQPNLLRPLADKVERETHDKYFLCGRYSIAIIEHAPRVISVLRILDGRTDYCTAIFGA